MAKGFIPVDRQTFESFVEMHPELRETRFALGITTFATMPERMCLAIAAGELLQIKASAIASDRDRRWETD